MPPLSPDWKCINSCWFITSQYCDIFDLDLQPCDPTSIQTTVAPYAYKSQVWCWFVIWFSSYRMNYKPFLYTCMSFNSVGTETTWKHNAYGGRSHKNFILSYPLFPNYLTWQDPVYWSTLKLTNHTIPDQYHHSIFLNSQSKYIWELPKKIKHL